MGARSRTLVGWVMMLVCAGCAVGAGRSGLRFAQSGGRKIGNWEGLGAGDPKRQRDAFIKKSGKKRGRAHRGVTEQTAGGTEGGGQRGTRFPALECRFYGHACVMPKAG